MIGVGVVGAGHFGAVHARALAGVEGARLVAACRTDAEAAVRFAAEHGGTPYADWRALLDDSAVDAVVVATPHHLHREVAVGALDAGRHVLLEKPMAATVADCDAILAAAGRSAGRLMVGHVTRFFLPVQAAEAILASGEVGRPIAGLAAFAKPWMEPNRQPWHLGRASGGGMLMTAGIHALDRLAHLMGAPVGSVTAMMGAAFHDQEADDTAFLALRFADGRMGQVTSLGLREGATTQLLHLACEGGILVLDDAGLRVGQGGRWRAIDGHAEPDPMLGALQRQWRAFLEAVAEGAEPPVGGAYGRHLVAVIEAADRASRDRREVVIEGAPDATA